MQYQSTITWQRDTSTPFNAKTYDRTHQIQFGGGSAISASSAPEFLGKKELPNPEELYTAAIASCFSLTFFYWAAVKGLNISHYKLDAIGKLGKNADGKTAMTDVILTPHVTLEGNATADAALLRELFHKAHEHCFISSSVKSNVSIQHDCMATHAQ